MKLWEGLRTDNFQRLKNILDWLFVIVNGSLQFDKREEVPEPLWTLTWTSKWKVSSKCSCDPLGSCDPLSSFEVSCEPKFLGENVAEPFSSHEGTGEGLQKSQRTTKWHKLFR